MAEFYGFFVFATVTNLKHIDSRVYNWLSEVKQVAFRGSLRRNQNWLVYSAYSGNWEILSGDSIEVQDYDDAYKYCWLAEQHGLIREGKIVLG